MSAGRARLSGAEYRKRAKEKTAKEAQLMKNTNKLDAFLKLPQTSAKSFESRSPENDACTSTSVAEPVGSTHDATPLSAHVVLESSVIAQQQILVSRDPDPATWTIDESTRDYIAANGIQQNVDADFCKSKRVYDDKIRYLSRSLFERQLLNGEKSLRNWLIYSESTGHVYCGPCLLFEGGTQFGSKEGFSDWKNASSRVSSHENASTHKLAVLSMKKRGNLLGRINCTLAAQLDEEIVYWRHVLKRVVATVKALASRGLPFRGHDEKFGSPQNGNYLMSLELIAEFDPFLADHISRHGNPGSGHTSYLSSTICEEFIALMAKKLTNIILSEIKSAKYFSLIVDSTPDISHVDQLTLVIRYVQPNGVPIERFLKFIPNAGHKAQEMTDAVTATLKEFGIDVVNCRGQSYDNAANMSGAYNGLQAQIKKLSPEADYVPCAAHSLNLVGETAAESCEEACRFFALLQELYNFFTASTHRWDVLQAQNCSESVPQNVTLESLSATRWSARADACQSLYQSRDRIIAALLSIEDDKQEKATTRSEAKGIRNNLERLETTFMTCFWGFILNRLNTTNKKLQSVDIDIFIVVQLYDSLIALVSDTREQFDDFEEKALKLSEEQEYQKDTRRKKKRKIRAGESAAGEVEMTGREHLRVGTFLVVIDSLLCEFRKRREAYQIFYEKFAFLTGLRAMSLTDVRLKTENLQTLYSSDLEESFADECIHFRAHCLSNTEERMTAVSLLKSLREEDLQTVYPNIDIALRMCVSVCTPVTNCSGERSFSWLRRVKHYLRSRMTEDRLNALAILSIESELLRSLDYDDLINTFATQKARRVAM